MSSRYRDTLARILLLIMLGSAPLVFAFNGDGNSTIIWHNADRQELAYWFLKQVSFVSADVQPADINPGWRIVAIADFDRDGNADYLWRSQATGENEFWLMNGIERIARVPLIRSSSDFIVGGAGDFNEDGYVDLVWRDSLRNQTVVWFMQATEWSGQIAFLVDATNFRWNLAGVADFNQDHQADLLWRDRFSGRNFIWLMRGTRRAQSIEIPAEPDLKAQLVGTASFGLLGNTDLVWRHASGANSVWHFHGTDHVFTSHLVPESIPSWQIAGAAGFTNSPPITAAADELERRLTLQWSPGTLSAPAIERRELGQTQWELLASRHLPFSFTNHNLTIGQRYEYRVGGESIVAGVGAAPLEERGRILLVVEQALAAQIGPELDLLKLDLAGDGWSVVSTNVPRHDDEFWANNVPAIASIKSYITNAYFQDPERTKMVYLIGHVPIPYSGFHNPDGHGGRCLPADLYYGDVDGIYTDTNINFPSFLDSPRLARHSNFIGDGKFDQHRVPPNARGLSGVELAVGRVDFALLPSFGGFTEAQMVQRYIQKTRRYRRQSLGLPERVLVGTFFASGQNRHAYAQARRISSRLYGIGPSSVIEADAFDTRNAGVWGILGGLGVPFGVLGREQFHQAADMTSVNREPRVAFAAIFASFVLDFHYTDNFMRAFLGSPTYGLGIMWFNPTEEFPLAFGQMALGETVGAGFLRSLSEANLTRPVPTYMAWLGDPTLRLNSEPPPFVPPDALKSNISFDWAPAPGGSTNFFVYRSNHPLQGRWTRLTPVPVTETRYLDFSALFNPGFYQVRAVKLVKTGSGSYLNLSQGLFFQLP